MFYMFVKIEIGLFLNIKLKLIWKQSVFWNFITFHQYFIQYFCKNHLFTEIEYSYIKLTWFNAKGNTVQSIFLNENNFFSQWFVCSVRNQIYSVFNFKNLIHICNLIQNFKFLLDIVKVQFLFCTTMRFEA